MTDKINVSVIFATYNRSDVIEDVLKKWREVDKNTRYSYEIICSDDASSDNTVEIIEKFTDLPITILRNEHGGASRARNAALKIAKGEIVIFTGDDIFPDLDFVNHHYENYLKFGDKICTLGRIEWHSDVKMNHLMYHITNIGCEQFGFAGLIPYGITDFRHFYTSNISVSKKQLDKLDKHFDLTFDRYGFEDIELGYRLHKNGVRIYYDPDLLAYHHHVYADVDKFCNRQMSAGDQMVVFASIHKEIKKNPIMGIELFEKCLLDSVDCYKDKESVRGKEILKHFESKKERTRELEELIVKNDKKEYRAECSALYRMIFQFYMYYGWALRLTKDKDVDESVVAEAIYCFMYPGFNQLFRPINGEVTEENSTRYEHRCFKVVIEDNLEHVKELRLDPLNVKCKVTDFKANVWNEKGANKQLKIKLTNGVNKSLDFTNIDDSQMYLTGLSNKNKYKVKIEMNVFPQFDISEKTESLIAEELAFDRDYVKNIYQNPKLNICIVGDDRELIQTKVGALNQMFNLIYNNNDVIVTDEICEYEFRSNYVYEMKDTSVSYEDLLMVIRKIYEDNISGMRLSNGDVIYMNILSDDEKKKLNVYNITNKEIKNV
ncbi:MAG: glycosyltransferase [Lachnospiraceae bacterium]|nr:glycosyltransferase [Lachnospiraceae bacterium]